MSFITNLTRRFAKFAPMRKAYPAPVAASSKSSRNIVPTQGKKYAKAWAWFVGLYCASLLVLGVFEFVSHWLVALLGRY